MNMLLPYCMNNEHAISDEVLDLVKLALAKGKTWMAYNDSLYFLNKEDIFFFKNCEEANEFSYNNISEYYLYSVIQINYPEEIFKKINYNDSPEIKQSPDLSQIKNTTMNEENVKYLKDNLKYMGFGDKLNEIMENNIREQKPEFSIKMQSEINKQPVEAELHFKKSDSTEMYFFNRYDIKLKHTEDQSKDLQQTFYINKGQGVTLKESYNLLNGRAVHKTLTDKEGEKYNAWIQLDLNVKDDKGNYKRQQYHENYGYNLNEVLAKYPVKELLDSKQKGELVNSLQKGNVQMVTFVKEGKSEKMYIEADPRYKDINLYNPQMKLQTREEKEKYQSVTVPGVNKAVKEEQGPDKKKDLTQDTKLEKQVAGKNNTVKQNDKSLLPKKRESTKKGMGIS